MTDNDHGDPNDGPSHKPEVIAAFLDQARWLVDWHRMASDRFEGKAATILGASSVLVALTSVSVKPIGEVYGRWSVVLTALAVFSALAFVGAGMFSVLTLWPRSYRGPSRDQLRGEWESYLASASRTDIEIVGMLVDQLIRGGDESPIDTLQADAAERGKRFRIAISLLFAGLASAVIAAVILFIEVQVR